MRKRFVLVLVVLSLLAAACGDDDDDEGGGEGDGTTTTAPSEDPDGDVDPDGVARLAYDLASVSQGGFTWDPAAGPSTGSSQLGPHHWVYGGLMRKTADGELVPDLAESATLVDANTITIVMREDLTLSDGSTPLDAETMKAILDANIARGVGWPGYRPGFFDLKTVDLTDDTTLTLNIAGTAASWYDLYLYGQETVPAPPDTDFSDPIGAGPFMIEDYSEAQSLTLVKNPEYWDAESIDLAGIELTNVGADVQAGVSALNAGQVDWTRLDPATIPAVADPERVVRSDDPQYLTQMIFCKSEAPLDDVLVRQAFNHAVDRDAINDALYGGGGAPAWDLWPDGHRLHNEDTEDAYPYDPEEAIALLEEAGVEDLTLDFIPHSSVLSLGEIIKQQFEEIGVTLNIIQSTAFADDLLGPAAKAPMGIVPRGGADRGKLDNLSGSTLGNICQYSDPEIDELVAELKLVSDSSDEGAEIWKEIDAIYSEDALALPIIFQPVVYGLDTERIGGYSLMVESTVAVPDMWELYVKA
ncbi:MAG: ABC transporter substrate-binding protein [Acidimicrobiales bacterium]